MDRERYKIELQADDSSANGNNAERLPHLDLFRSFVIFLLVPGHALLLYASGITWHLRGATESTIITRFALFLHLWMMPALFFLAGAALQLSLRKRSITQLLRERFRRLVIPLIFGIIVIVPPQVYFERISHEMIGRSSPHNFSGSYLQFYSQYFNCCYPEQNLSYHHLWFLLYLFIYTALGFALKIFHNNRSRQLNNANPGVSDPIRFIALPIIILSGVEILLQPFLHKYWITHLHYFALLVVGYLFHANRRFITHIDKFYRKSYLLVALISLFSLNHFNLLSTKSPTSDSIYWEIIIKSEIGMSYFFAASKYITSSLLKAAAEWTLIINIYALALRLSHKFLFVEKFIRPMAMTWYILHQTVLIAVAYYTLPLGLPLPLEYVIIAILTILLTTLFSAIIIRIPFVAGLCGGQYSASSSISKNQNIPA